MTIDKIIHVDALNPSRLVVESFSVGSVQTEKQIFDLTEYQGGPFRLYAEKNGELSTDINRDHYWLLSEALVPERKVESVSTGITDENGQEQTVMREVPLDLNQVHITTFSLPEVTEDGD